VLYFVAVLAHALDEGERQRNPSERNRRLRGSLDISIVLLRIVPLRHGDDGLIFESEKRDTVLGEVLRAHLEDG